MEKIKKVFEAIGKFWNAIPNKLYFILGVSITNGGQSV